MRVLELESRAVADLAPRIGQDFVRAVELLHSLRSIGGKAVVCGTGKSGLIAHKIAATFSSTGTPAVFLHPTDAAHGDLGMVAPHDVVIAISKSGETSELLTIVPTVKKLGSSLIAMVGNLTSTLARKSDIVLDCCVSREACPLDLAPTSSTTVALAMGDALAMALIKVGNFTPGQFAVFHPGGSLGRRLLLTVADLMHSGDRNPVLPPTSSAFDVVDKLTATKLGGVNVVDGSGRLVGLITDGDVRRKLRVGPDFFNLTATDLMTPSPGTISPQASANEAYRQMEYRKSQISVLPVVDANGICVGLIRLHDVIGGGKE